MVDETKLNQFIDKILGDLGGAMSAPLVRIFAPAIAHRRLEARPDA